MINFNTKLNRALEEMAQLVQHGYHRSTERKTVSTVQWGVGDKLSEKRNYGSQSEEEIVDVVRQKFKTDYQDATPERLQDLFGVSSVDELLQTVKIKHTESAKSSYNELDHKALSMSKTWEKIAKILSDGPGDYKWNIFAIDNNIININIVKRDYILKHHPETDLDNSITFVKGSSSGDVLDAHMLIHTAAHAVASTGDNWKLYEEITEALDAITSIVSSAVSAARSSNQWEREGIDKDKFEFLHETSLWPVPIAQFCHFKAATHLMAALDTRISEKRRYGFMNRSVADSVAEIVHEMISVFIKRNRVRFEPNEYCFITSRAILSKVALVRDLINTNIKIMLDKCVGKIISP